MPPSVARSARCRGRRSVSNRSWLDEAADFAQAQLDRIPREMLGPAGRALYENQWSGPPQCEVKNLADTAQCTEAAEYALTSRNKVGYVCTRCLADLVRVNTRYGPVTVERLRCRG